MAKRNAHRQRSWKLSMLLPIVKHASGDGITVAGVAEASPEQVFEFLCCSPHLHPEVITSIQEVEEHERREEGFEGQILQLEYTMRAFASLFGKNWPQTMRLRLVADRSNKQGQFSMVGGTAMIAHLSGVNVVLPLGDDLATLDLQAEVSQAVSRFLESRDQALEGQAGQLAAGMAGTGEGASARRCIIIMHQRLKPRFAPPPFGRLLRGHMLSNQEKTLLDVLALYNKPAQKAQQAQQAQQAMVACEA